jgi:hypothetical protein
MQYRVFPSQYCVGVMRSECVCRIPGDIFNRSQQMQERGSKGYEKMSVAHVVTTWCQNNGPFRVERHTNMNSTYYELLGVKDEHPARVPQYFEHESNAALPA